MEQSTPLFRDEALGGQRSRLHGEIILRQSTSTRVILASIVSIVIAALAWILLGNYARTESARGLLVPANGMAKVFALRPGVVNGLFVSEGQFVAKGLKLADIRATQPSSDGELYTDSGVRSLKTQEELALSRIEVAHQRAVAERRRLETTISGLKRQRSQIQVQLKLQRELVDSAATTYEQLKTLLIKGFVSKIEIERRRQALIMAQQQEGQLIQQLGQVETELLRSINDFARIETEHKASVIDSETAVQTLRQQKSRLQTEGAYSVEAPISGRVTAVQAALGRAVGGQVPLLTIMPKGSALRANIYAPSRAIGFVRIGQEVKLLYDAFPYQRFGSFSGRIETISRVVLAPGEIDAPLRIEEPVYRISVRLDQQSINAFGETLPLQPGMTLTANIILDRMSFWDWLMTPLRAIRNRT